MEKIIISGEIGWDVLPRDIMSKLDAANGKDLDVQIASPGGFVFDGIEIYNAFKDYKRKYPDSQMVVTIKGLAASMASYLAVNPAFDLVAAEDNAVFMIHNVWGGAVGDYREMKKAAEVYEGLTDLIGQAYSQRTGKNKKSVREMMDDESWFFGSEILEAGFIDEIIKTDEEKEKQSAVATAKLKFKNVSDKLKDQNTEVNKIAAIIKCESEVEGDVEILTFEEIKKGEKSTDNNDSHPADNAGNNIITEVISMSLKELLETNPAAKAEYEKELAAKYEAGRKDALDISAKAAVYASSKEYSEQVKAVAIDVMQGKKSMESLETIVAVNDMLNEKEKSIKAQGEQPPDTTGEQTIPENKSGVIDSFEALMAEAKRAKTASGVEVR